MKTKLFFKGPLLTRSGYGEQARFAMRALKSRPDLFDIYIQPLQWGKTSWVTEEDDERIWIDSVIEKTIGFTQQCVTFDASFQVTIPNEWENIAPVNIGFTAGIETTMVSPGWLGKGNEMDKIIVVSNHSKQVYKTSTCIATEQNTGKQIDNYLKDKDSDPIVLSALDEYVNYPSFGCSLDLINYDDLNGWIEYQVNMFWSGYEEYINDTLNA